MNDPKNDELQELRLRVAELERIAEQGAIFKRLAEASGLGMGMADLKGRITYANLALCEAMGEASPQDALGNNVRSYYPDSSWKKLGEEVFPAVQRFGQWTGELPLISRQGQLIYAMQSVFLIHDVNGQPTCFANVIIDISEQKRVTQALQESHDELEQRVRERTAELKRHQEHLEELVAERTGKLAESEQRYRTIFETTGTSTIIFDNDAVITLINEEFASLSGYSREEVEGKLTWMTFFNEESLKKMRKYHELRSKDPTSVPRCYEAQVIDRAGKVHDGLITIAMVPGTTQRVASFQDLTDLKRAQQQMYRADKMAALGQIIAGVAHEINNPNNFIYFNLPILRKYIEAICPLLEQHLERNPELKILNMSYETFLEDVFRLLENMEHGSQRITSIVSDLKTYIRSDEDRDMKSVRLQTVIDQVMTLIGKQVRKQVRRFEVNVADDLPPVRINPGKIEQVLINLVINAGQAADKEDSWIKLSASLADDGAFVEILVRDNGSGIPPDSLEQIFEPFFTSKGREAGTGLGLSISHQIVSEHGGSIDVTSEPGQGSCFTVRLPVDQEV